MGIYVIIRNANHIYFLQYLVPLVEVTNIPEMGRQMLKELSSDISQCTHTSHNNIARISLFALDVRNQSADSCQDIKQITLTYNMLSRLTSLSLQ